MGGVGSAVVACARGVDARLLLNDFGRLLLLEDFVRLVRLAMLQLFRNVALTAFDISVELLLLVEATDTEGMLLQRSCILTIKRELQLAKVISLPAVRRYHTGTLLRSCDGDTIIRPIRLS